MRDSLETGQSHEKSEISEKIRPRNNFLLKHVGILPGKHFSSV